MKVSCTLPTSPLPGLTQSEVACLSNTTSHDTTTNVFKASLWCCLGDA
jgi:hypothetical protein